MHMELASTRSGWTNFRLEPPGRSARGDGHPCSCAIKSTTASVGVLSSRIGYMIATHVGVSCVSWYLIPQQIVCSHDMLCRERCASWYASHAI